MNLRTRALILEPRFIVTLFSDGSVRITNDTGSVNLTPEQVKRVAEALADA